ncbi:MAG: pyridoxamine 5-phosphate oxidase-related FMN-binding protein [Firmicutes bacterium]|nr:pyridoxamine 5-phosphate oxidase-related FMN-binding protein [Bacillota bacterium]
MAVSKETIQKYLQETPYIALATVNEKQAPALRTLGSFAPDEFKVYFSTGETTAKVGQIRSNQQVAILFQHENQKIPSFVNITISGTAHELDKDAERSKAIALLSARSPRFKERADKKELNGTAFFRIDPEEIKVVDLSKGPGANGIEIIKY